ncbi:2-polyprenyl-6-methoxyphenol hydroxylase-like oxidoreductase [Cylindrospermum stagnale PCC 7417]|uniref:2-polyprenyl-6-methoxyphenol hydroxylase-like oxidoreductase n=1 Tax=Cylindrospermum stagnale PCC 7417 TaxID=56107 RepID=K9X1I4_9NOST|nr:tryptophan 7-halogenase [Cylindrospermum stagnale]AFZ26485.1 2-polyprenyl-6-methoxyphenol hydroxylase-like oxidoreductase [Cylindrospermum stagnale PCC 7417]
MEKTIHNVVVLGGGSAGFLSALALKVKMPSLNVVVVHSKTIPVIGVGEATTAWIPWFLHTYLGLNRQQFYEETQPIWKLGIKFIWGNSHQSHFNYPFVTHLADKLSVLDKSTAYYCLDSTRESSIYSLLMEQYKSPCFRKENGDFVFDERFGYHIENASFVSYLERRAAELDIKIIDQPVVNIQVAENGYIHQLKLDDGTTLAGDLFVDCSGFRSTLLGEILQEPFCSFSSSLFNDSAVTGTWMRDDVIYPFTTAETMQAGWCWRIDLPEQVNRGYVYSSAFISDDDALAEMKRQNPLMGDDHHSVVRFKSGRHQRFWVNNVVGVGNASGFVEPLESTGLHMIGETIKCVCDVLIDSDQQPTPGLINLANQAIAEKWDDIRDFLSIHFKFNRRVTSDFWQHCWQQTDIGEAEAVVDFFQNNGPSPIGQLLLRKNSVFKYNGYLNLLMGQQVATKYQGNNEILDLDNWRQVKNYFLKNCDNALPIHEAIQVVKERKCQWLSS